MAELFLLSERQMGRIAPHFPCRTAFPGWTIGAW